MSGADTFRALLQNRAEVAQISLTEELATKLEGYYRLLAHWNQRINLTSLPLENPSDLTIDRLFLEPVAAASLLGAHVGVSFDLGTGGGSPAITGLDERLPRIWRVGLSDRSNPRVNQQHGFASQSPQLSRQANLYCAR